ncbi:RagB/SusD family nutrient uptake outer membrane protein [Bacteroides sp. 224]|uniref:RagB/SusD family nutrient uptake outer membrane protein n=1 Tax=Bacteroides sp. 224 TaxID=2302936 RepID=UPI0013CFAF41|nr:RagB/SusD family nutrient uptake outer membrane protein [Bacteroides sp. 224]NDV64618.1 RagB/SusD family nutrient uptake outer membrane protein [Bacteroides sp. 224]
MKRYIHNICYIIAVGFLASCSDFLDVSPKDKVLEDDQYKTEVGINGALNGLYRQFISTSLYGGNLSQTTLDAMAHFYTYPPTQPSDSKLSHTLFFLCNGRSDEYGSAADRFGDIWKNGYNSLLNINYFLKCLGESTAVMNSNNKLILTGEAYGLRAYLHFDLFRLFGPRWEERSSINKVLPYNRSTATVLNHAGYEENVYSTADEYMKYVLDDIREAERLLAADPILTDDTAISKKLSDDFYKNRNRRMNYYAVKALEARVLQYMEDHENAAIAAKVVTDVVGGDVKKFTWADATKVVANKDYSFFSEVIFGINNPNMTSNFNSFFNKSELATMYAVDRNNLMKNIYEGFGDNLKAIIDVRARQWVESNNESGASSYSQEGTYISNKFNMVTNTNIPALVDFQPLIRITEMYYIQAEAALKVGETGTAAELLNRISSHRGIPDTSSYYLTETSSDEDFQSHILSEYYKEFYGEGQVYFYHKRLNTAKMFYGYKDGVEEKMNTKKMYNIPLPKIETEI